MSKHPAQSLATALALAGAVLAQSVAEASSVVGPSVVVPASPLPFEVVNLRLRVDSCAFDPPNVDVKTVANAVQVQVGETVACSPPGPPMDVDVRLGAYPPGTYAVELVSVLRTLAGLEHIVRERLQFTVQSRAEVPNRSVLRYPLADYTGLWWNQQESGWGLSIHQSARDALFGTLFVYDAQNRAQWFTIQPGGWTSSRRWEGPLYRTTGPYFAGASYDPSLVLVQAAGSAVLEFAAAPPPSGYTTARFTYTVDGVTTVKTIARMAF
jgi:hypothetical protein